MRDGRFQDRHARSHAVLGVPSHVVLNRSSRLNGIVAGRRDWVHGFRDRVRLWNTEASMSLDSLFVLDRYVVHQGAHAAAQPELTIVTPDGCWAYAASFTADRQLADASLAWTINARLTVVRGHIGIGIAAADGKSFIKEAIVPAASAPVSIRLRVPAGVRPGDLVIRNAGDGPAQVIASEIVCEQHRTLPYLVGVTARDVGAETRPSGGDQVVFDDVAAASLNDARMNWLSSLGLDLAGRRVLDAGAGVGHFTRYYTVRGASVVAIEGRSENVAILRERCPGVSAHVVDVQADDLAPFGRFDIVHCFGLLYHLDSPVIALRRMHDVCDDILLLETMVCDSSAPVAILADETGAVNQALAGLGCRPSPTFIVVALNRIGFKYIYGTTAPPLHPDFDFEWRDNCEATRDGHNLRSVFVASRRRLSNPGLVELV
jgi:SAM-dependent methyltransferase